MGMTSRRRARTGAGSAAERRAGDDSAPATKAKRRALKVVIVLNLAMGFVDAGAGLLGHSHALQGKALEFLGTGLAMLLGLAGVSRNASWRARCAMLRGALLVLLASALLGAIAMGFGKRRPPDGDVMRAFGLLGLVTSVSAAWVLHVWRDDDLTALDVWRGSIKVLGSSVLVMIAGAAVYEFQDVWPDSAAAAVIAGLVFLSASGRIRRAARELGEER